MIVRPRPRGYQLFFILRGSIVPQILPQVLAVALLAGVVTLLHRRYPESVPAFSSAPLALIGMALSIFLGFRNSACYDRWWEARKLWGQLVVELRALARQTLTLLPGEDAESVALRRRLILESIGYARGLAAALRGRDLRPALEPFVPAEALPRLLAARAPLDALMLDMGHAVARCRDQGRLDSILLSLFETRLAAVAAIQAACERLRFTPLPFAYTLLLHRTAYLFCILLPFGLVDSVGMATPLVTAVVAYTFFGLDVLGDELEEPFGMRPNNLPLDAMARTIEINLLEALGEAELPAPAVPDRYVLL